MQLYSTNDKAYRVGLKEAIFRGLPPDNGLFMPEKIAPLPSSFFAELPDMDFAEIAFRVSTHLIGDEIAEAELRELTAEAINFPAPVVQLDAQRYILELFHGPSLAFKDFGARFMARLMSYFNREESQKLIILVATSGDTGGAVAAGFYQTPGIQVVILYPSGKVSELQEKQLTTLGHNVTALEVDGTFDDCQALVKQAFLDEELRSELRLSSANSINIARLIPQSFYYFEAYRQLGAEGNPVVFCIPSGNFGNLTAGLLAQRMGLPVHHFIAATNRNDVVPDYLQTGSYRPRPSVPTLSNAMDVGNPSNFARMLDIYGLLEGKYNLNETTWEGMREMISGYAFDDAATRVAMREVEAKYGYVMDPHGAVGYLALEDYLKKNPASRGVVLETAHPSKFKPDVEETLGHAIHVPARLAELANKEKVAIPASTEYTPFKTWLLDNY